MLTTIIISSFILSTIFTFFIQKKFIKNNIIDKINSRSSHESTATRSGGTSIFLTLFLISFISYFFKNEIFDFSFLIPISILFAVGLYDDLNNIDYKLKFIFQIITAKIIIDNGLIIDNLHGFAGIYEISRMTAHLITIFIIVAIINSINFIDGIDGLAISNVILFICGFEFFANNNTDFYYLSILILSSLVPIYYFNFKKKDKVFLGDSGSYLLGGIISLYIIYIFSDEYIIKPEYDLNKILFVFSVLTYPIVDVVRVFFIRLKNKKSPFNADKNHIHHLIGLKLKSHALVTLIILTSSMIFNFLIHLFF